ncbi:hypothetical protein L1987_80542 [Smallanthus sonchifolius]|uniref:Uncharacterized protein n=1 Tax=Smallanthus sonchifolius TaxID=185202 RepID=A0ACB8YP09_9ASTR|nr:hypothetical protein L1987_80542 [Smallanthus sonchifolius]
MIVLKDWFLTLQSKIKLLKRTTLYREAADDFGRKVAIRGRDNLFPAEWWSTYGGACPNLFYNKEQENPDPISHENINSVKAWVNEKEIYSNEIESSSAGFEDHEIFDGLKGSGDENGENNVQQIVAGGTRKSASAIEFNVVHAIK